MQICGLHWKENLDLVKSRQINFTIRPIERGVFHFSDPFVYAPALTYMFQRKVAIHQREDVPAYPSILQMKKYELKVFAKTAISGIKKIRRLGHKNEFEQIKNYIQGDVFARLIGKRQAEQAS